jgi:3-oxoacyl-[acyl-carrier-protein] synthase II
MTPAPREIWITGVGIVSCLGEGVAAHWAGLNAPAPTPDRDLYPPYAVHRMASLDFERQIPKRGDLRQMEPWQRIGTYAAGLALEAARLKGNPSTLAHVDMIVAAGAGERDEAADAAILSGLASAERPNAFLNERLLSDLRPTLFLAQLSNLLAGSIAIVHGVTSSSRTFMGEEASGVDAVRTAHARIATGQSRIALVGSASNAEQLEPVLRGAMGNTLWRGEPTGTWARTADGGGMTLGSIGAFLVLEEAGHAAARNQKALACLRHASSSRARRVPGAVTAELERLWTVIAPRLAGKDVGVISGASGCEPATSEERAFLARRPPLAVRATADHVGYGIEPQFPLNIAIAAIALNERRLFPTFDSDGSTSVKWIGPLQARLPS